MSTYSLYFYILPYNLNECLFVQDVHLFLLNSQLPAATIQVIYDQAGSLAFPLRDYKINSLQIL